MGIHVLPKHLNPQPDGSASTHRSYERVYESWAACEDKGALTLREFVSSPEQPLHINCEHLVELIGDAQHDASGFGRWIFEEAAAILSNIAPDSSYIDNNEFSHTAKYLFCAACFTPPLRSVLDHSESLGVATALVDRAVTFCEMSQSLGTSPLIIRGVIASNLRAWVERGDIRSFYFHPESLRSEKFALLLQHARDKERAQAAARPAPSSSGRPATPHLLNQMFCTLTSPERFLVYAFSRQIVLPVPELVGPLKKLLAAHLGEDAGKYPFLATAHGASPNRESQTTQSVVPSLDFKGGVYVDVFGTLINNDGTPNHRLVQVVKDLMRHVPPRRVFLVSDSQDEEIAQALSFFNDRPPLIHKDSLYGSELEYLIDNSEPDPQGLHARHHLLPEQAVQQATKLVEDDTMYFPT